MFITQQDISISQVTPLGCILDGFETEEHQTVCTPVRNRIEELKFWFNCYDGQTQLLVDELTILQQQNSRVGCQLNETKQAIDALVAENQDLAFNGQRLLVERNHYCQEQKELFEENYRFREQLEELRQEHDKLLQHHETLEQTRNQQEEQLVVTKVDLAHSRQRQGNLEEYVKLYSEHLLKIDPQLVVHDEKNMDAKSLDMLNHPKNQNTSPMKCDGQHLTVERGARNSQKEAPSSARGLKSFHRLWYRSATSGSVTSRTRGHTDRSHRPNVSETATEMSPYYEVDDQRMPSAESYEDSLDCSSSPTNWGGSGNTPKAELCSRDTDSGSPQNHNKTIHKTHEDVK
eukprot:GHVL01024258.1.p1 GENE.GHVL01024258.1~~GHVL01024258.1.p1  ORF type:complete len:346 (-),score=50.44 GHVL01024258.1:713-1750(-)